MADELPPIIPAQSRAGRALIGWSQEELAAASGLSREKVAQFEAETLEMAEDCQRAIKAVLEENGVIFMPELGGGGAGVRLKFPRQTVKRIQTWENEGGPTGEDDIV